MRVLILFSTLVFFIASCTDNSSDDLTFVIKNSSSVDRTAATFSTSVNDIFEDSKDIDWSKIGFNAEKQLPFQLIDNDADGTPDEVLISTDLKAGESKEITVTFSEENENVTFEKRTQAEISHKVGGKWEGQKYIDGKFENVTSFTAPEQHTDHSYYIRYEGPGWESDKVGYRFYLDWRNAVDIFGKKTADMVLQDVGQDGFDSYHEPSDWGMDILKVGNSLGLGSIGFWNDGKATRVEKTSGLQSDILQNGILQSKIRTTYTDWEINDIKTTLTSDLTIQAGSRLTRQDITLSENLPNICTGIVKHDSTEVLVQKPANSESWGYIATFGKQSLAGDNLGMVVFVNGSQFIDFQEDEFSHIVALKPNDSKVVNYYFAAAWEQETDGIKDLAAFETYLQNTIDILNNQ